MDTDQKTLILAGGAGFLGMSAAHYFQKKNYRVVILTRGKTREKDGIIFIHWDGKHLGQWQTQIDGAHGIINFTGRSVNCLYNQTNRQEILQSRIDSVSVLTEAILQVANPPRVFIQAASLAIFGDTKQLCDEYAPHGKGFSVDVCQQWEKEFYLRDLPSRKVLLRIGFALGKNGGALAPLIKLTKYFLGGTVGSGQQYISWLHINDLNRMFNFALDNEISGTFNATAEKAVTNAIFMKTLRKVLGKPWSPPTPAWLVRIFAKLLMKTEPDLALTGRNCTPKRFLEAGFQFLYKDLENALRSIIKNNN